MSNQEKKVFLSQYLKAKERLDSVSEEMLRIRSEAVKITPVIRDMPAGSYASDKVGLAVEWLEACADKLEQESRRMQEQLEEIAAVIDDVEDETFRRLLMLRYINGYTWEEIAEKMHYTWRHTQRLHAAALNRVMVCHTERP